MLIKVTFSFRLQKCGYVFVKVGDTLIWEENAAKSLELIIDSGLTFHERERSHIISAKFSDF